MLIKLIKLSDTDLAAACWWDQTISKNLKKTPNYTGLARKHRFLTGYIGELAVRHFLEAFHVLHQHRISTDGKSKRSEFFVWRNGEKKRMEVKAGSASHYSKFMYPHKQWDCADLYIGARIEAVRPELGECDVSLMGWLAAKDVKMLKTRDFGHGVPTLYCEYENMRPIQGLIPLLEKTYRTQMETPFETGNTAPGEAAATATGE